MTVPVDGLYQIISGGPFSTGGKACIRPGPDGVIVIVGATPYNAMMSWRGQPAPGGAGITLTSDTGLVLCYTPNAGANVQLRPATMIGDPSAAWIPTDLGGPYCMVAPLLAQSLALTIEEGGPPWQIKQIILADETQSGQSVAQAWMFIALGDEAEKTLEDIPAYEPPPACEDPAADADSPA